MTYELLAPVAGFLLAFVCGGLPWLVLVGRERFGRPIHFEGENGPFPSPETFRRVEDR
jgi:hypothetical protein